MKKEANLIIKSLFVCFLLTIASVGAEPLEKKFGPDRQRGYRPEPEFEIPRRGFENRDRANFLGSRLPSPPDGSSRRDLPSSPSIGGQK